MEGEKELALPSVGEEQIGGAYTLRNDTEEELLREMLKRGWHQERECQTGSGCDQNAEQRIQKDEDELRLDSWIQIRSTG